MVANLDRSTKLTAKGDTPSLEFQVLWQSLRGELAQAGTGGMGTIRSVSASGSVAPSDFLLVVDASGGNVTLTLPSAASSMGAYIIVKKVDASANTVTIDGNGSETIDGAADAVISVQYTAIGLVCDGSEWWIV